MASGLSSLPTLDAVDRERQRRRRVSTQQSHLDIYWDKPAKFVQECFTWRPNEGPTVDQLDILTSLWENKRLAVRGPHGLGKTAVAAWAILWFASTRDGKDWKIPTTASSWRQLSKYLWPEIHKWSRRLIWWRLNRQPYDTRSELQTLSLKLRTGEAFAVASDVPELIEGAHADHLLYLLDESKTIPAETFDAVEGAFSGGNLGQTEALALSISTPGLPAGRFFDIHSRKPGYEDWTARHVTMQDSVASGRINRVWVEQRKKQWGVNSAIFKNRVLGEFASSESDSVIPLEWVEAAVERWKAWKDTDPLLGEITALGVDVARSGPDSTYLALRVEKTIAELRPFSKEDTMQTTGRVKGVLKRHGGWAVVDVIGVGAGVCDRLKELKYNVIAFNAAAKAWNIARDCEIKDRSGELGFANMRAAAWWHFRELLDPFNEEDILIPDDDILVGDLTAPTWKVTSTGRIQIESKDDIKERLGRSTDAADAVIQAFILELIKPDLTPYDVWGGSREDEEPTLEAVMLKEGMYWPSDFTGGGR